MARPIVARYVTVLAVLASIMALSAIATTRVLEAGGVTTALYSTVVNITNTGSTDLDDIQAPFALSGCSLIDGNFLASDALNALIHKGDTDIPGMPPTTCIQVEGAVQADGSVFTEHTTAAQNTTLNDLPLMPAVAEAGDAFYFGCDNPCRIVTWDVDTAGVGTWTITYEYWNGTNYTALTNVDDRTSGWTILGRKSVSWDMPGDWATNTVTGSAVNSYWGRARVSAFTSETTQPLGSRAQYENGQWWTWVEDHDVDTQEQVTLYLGGSTGLVTAHQLFPGTAGIITGDVAGLELGSAYSIGVQSRLDASAAGASTCIICKTGAVTVNVSGSTVSPAIGVTVTGAATGSTASLPIVIPATGVQTVIIASDGTNSATWANASTGGMRSYPQQTVADTANNYTWGSASGTDYIEYIRADTAAPTIYNFDTTYADFSGGTLSSTTAYSGALGLSNQ